MTLLSLARLVSLVSLFTGLLLMDSSLSDITGLLLMDSSLSDRL